MEGFYPTAAAKRVTEGSKYGLNFIIDRRDRTTKRREILISLGLTPLLPPLLGSSAMAAATKAAEQEAELLFVQSADAADLKDGILTLTGINPATIFFSDRPERIVGHEPTEDFVAQWGVGDNNFAQNPPNAALSILVGVEPQEVILELRNPQIKDGNLVYEVTVLQGKATVSGDCSITLHRATGADDGKLLALRDRERRHAKAE